MSLIFLKRERFPEELYGITLYAPDNRKGAHQLYQVHIHISFTK